MAARNCTGATREANASTPQMLVLTNVLILRTISHIELMIMKSTTVTDHYTALNTRQPKKRERNILYKANYIDTQTWYIYTKYI